MMKKTIFLLFLASIMGLGTISVQAWAPQKFPTIGKIYFLHPEAEEVLSKEASIEVIASGFDWCEGPVWKPDEGHDEGGYLLFSEIPSNSIRQWTAATGDELYLQPAGYTGRGQYSRESGSNGLALDAQGQLVMCEHGDRRVSVLTKNGGKRTLADAYQGKRLNSPNDLCIRSDGTIYFTDPIYGLPKQQDDPMRELNFCGVYRRTPAGEVTLVTDKLNRPNGIALSPDEKTLYVAQSDSAATIWMSFPVNADGSTGEGKIFKDVTEMAKDKSLRGSNDGMKVDREGRLWATGPGGVHVMKPDGTLIARIDTGEFCSNCAFGGKNGDQLFITSSMFLCRVPLKKPLSR